MVQIMQVISDEYCTISFDEDMCTMQLELRSKLNHTQLRGIFSQVQLLLKATETNKILLCFEAQGHTNLSWASWLIDEIIYNWQHAGNRTCIAWVTGPAKSSKAYAEYILSGLKSHDWFEFRYFENTLEAHLWLTLI